MLHVVDLFCIPNATQQIDRMTNKMRKEECKESKIMWSLRYRERFADTCQCASMGTNARGLSDGVTLK